jgi:fucose permease
LLAILIFASIPLWKKAGTAAGGEAHQSKPQPLSKTAALPGAKDAMLVFFTYCALEQTTGLWASSYLALHRGVDEETAAFFGSLFFIGITVGRGLSGFLAMKLNDTQMIRLGFTLTALGIAALMLPGPQFLSLGGLILIGLGCAPVYPCIIHMTPDLFGKDKSQAIIGVQIAFAYLGFCTMPPLFGLIANHISIKLLPAYLLVLLALIVVMHEKLVRMKTKQ